MLCRDFTETVDPARDRLGNISLVASALSSCAESFDNVRSTGAATLATSLSNGDVVYARHEMRTASDAVFTHCRFDSVIIKSEIQTNMYVG